MAESTTVESPSSEGGVEPSLSDLRDELAAKQEELEGLRAQRMQAQIEASTRVQAAVLEREIAKVDAEIEVERNQLEVQQNIDPQLVGTGIASEPIPEVPPAPSEVEETKGVPEPETPSAPEIQTQEFGQPAEFGDSREGDN